MKRLLATAALTFSLAAYTQADTAPMLGGDTDAHGCKPSTGASYSFLLKKCVQVFDAAQIKLTAPNNDTLAVYGIQSANKARVELFGADIAENTILRQTKRGYASADGKIRLQKSKRGWKLHQAK